MNLKDSTLNNESANYTLVESRMIVSFISNINILKYLDVLTFKLISINQKVFIYTLKDCKKDIQMKDIIIFKKANEMRTQSLTWKKQGYKVGFVPTMGFLHQGHLSLIEKAKNCCDKVILSIFVNPTQFGEGEDLDKYPRNLKRDIELASTKNTDAIFLPSAEEIYPKNYQTFVNLETLPNFLCGKSRPGHFRGVATIVTKFFNIACPDQAFFGEKDFQQLAVIRQMTKDLNFGIKITGVPIVREEDGLAMSSRNTYLSDQNRKKALSLYKSLTLSQEIIKKGISDTDEIIETARKIIEDKEGLKTDYIKICDPYTLEDIKKVTKPALMALAVFVGKTRLIDNIILNP